jgi:hypothetical protein
MIDLDQRTSRPDGQIAAGYAQKTNDPSEDVLKDDVL